MTTGPIFPLPREHGAYGQLAFPLLTSLAVAGITTGALLIGLSVVAGFLAHEPLLILIGRRGVRARREERRPAARALTLTSTVAVGAGVYALLLLPAIRWSFLLPLVPAALLGIAITIGHEKRALGEVAAALAFSFVSVPICLASGASIRTALSVAIAFAAVFVTATLAVRAVILRVRGGGHPRAERITRISVLTLSAALGIALPIATLGGITPWATTAAAAPGLAGAAWLSLLPPSPTRLRTVGWTLVATSGAAALILIGGL